ncbi:MAG TPA: Ku protein [Planctomycetota bacterium]|nr:Ku protein [Planctomycetota bacterium]
MARPIWSGAISFGIVNIPVKLFGAVRDRGLHFHQISEKHKKRIRYRKVAEGHDEEVHQDDIVKGYELSKGRYVIVAEKEFQQLAAKKSKAIDIIDFVGLHEIDPLYFDQPYYVVPDEKAGRSYWLLLEALAKADKVAIAQFVMRSKEYLAAVRPLNGTLCLETMRYADEIVSPKEIGIDDSAREKPQDRELKIANQLIESMTTTFDPTHYRDDYRERVMAFIEKKAKGKGVEVLDEEWEDEHHEKPGKVIDLMAALEESLNRAKGGAHPRSRKPALKHHGDKHPDKGHEKGHDKGGDKGHHGRKRAG